MARIRFSSAVRLSSSFVLHSQMGATFQPIALSALLFCLSRSLSRVVFQTKTPLSFSVELAHICMYGNAKNNHSRRWRSDALVELCQVFREALFCVNGIDNRAREAATELAFQVWYAAHELQPCFCCVVQRCEHLSCGYHPCLLLNPFRQMDYTFVSHD